MKTKIIITLIALSLCPALYAMPQKDNTLQELKKEISDTVKEEISNYDNFDLAQAILSKDSKMVSKILASKKFDLNTWPHILGGDTFLALASDLGDLEIVKILVENGADVNFKGWADYSPVERATFNNHVQIVKFLIEEKEATARPLYYTIQYRRVKIAEILLENGANVNIPDRDGDTPLHLCLYEYNHTKIIDIERIQLKRIAKLFIKYGADLTIKNNNGQTVMDTNPELITQLLKEIEREKAIKYYGNQALQGLAAQGQIEK